MNRSQMITRIEEKTVETSKPVQELPTDEEVERGTMTKADIIDNILQPRIKDPSTPEAKILKDKLLKDINNLSRSELGKKGNSLIDQYNVLVENEIRHKNKIDEELDKLSNAPYGKKTLKSAITELENKGNDINKISKTNKTIINKMYEWDHFKTTQLFDLVGIIR